ncbi:MAG: NAD(P)H-hydrate epimerase [Thermomicrobiales bacterium]|nr:NAD(P)H-hydrate epimerase [Thermomicrobiales bacterium]
MHEIRGVPALDPAEMARVDRVMTERFGVETLQLMELAARAVAIASRGMLPGGDARGRRVVALCGRGGNGGDGMAAARLLHAWGAQTMVALSCSPERLNAAAAHQFVSLQRLGVPVLPPSDAAPVLPEADLLIDALLGFGLTGPPTGASAALIRAANVHSAPKLAVDVPSGLDAASGVPFDPCLRATRTLTLALPKTGLLAPGARAFVGRLTVADIGVPPEAYAAIGRDIGPVFAATETIDLW